MDDVPWTNILEFCQRTINVDNVNEIPQDWNPPANATYFMTSTLNRCKSSRVGFLPWFILNAVGGLTWFLKIWGSRIDLNRRFPYRFLRWGESNESNARNIYHTSLQYCLLGNHRTMARLLEAGAIPERQDFRQFVGSLGCMSFPLVDSITDHFLNLGAADYDITMAPSWVVEKCRSYGERRRRCQATTVTLGALLNRNRCWDRFLVRQIMRIVWATRRHIQWITEDQ